MSYVRGPSPKVSSGLILTRAAAERNAQAVMDYWHAHGHPEVEAWPTELGRNQYGVPSWGTASNLVNGMPQKARAA